MRSCPKCADWIPDAARFCPSCGRELGGVAAGPAAAPTVPSVGPAPEGEDRGRAESRVRTLGVLYLSVGIYILLAQALAIAMALTGMTAEILRDMQLPSDPQVQEFVDRYLEMLENPVAASLPGLFGLGMGAFYVWSGTRLRALRDPGAAQVAALAMIFLSCCHSDCCACCFSIPLGVYALFVLNEQATKAVFRG